MSRWLAVLLVLGLGTALAADWPCWRGSRGDGCSDEAVPLTWGPKENITWRVSVPGTGHSSPIVVGERVLLTTFVPASGRLLLCYNRSDGRLIWQKTVLQASAEPMHKNNTPASATPASDGKRVWTTFTDGSNIVAACHDLQGQLLWQQKFPGFDSRHGFSASPVLHKGLLLINGDSDGNAFLAALDAQTGLVKWRVARPNRIRSFSTPLVVQHKNRSQLVLAGSASVTAFEPENGKTLWTVPSETQKFVATVAHTEGVYIATGTSPTSTLVGIDEAGKILWSNPQGAAYVPSPVPLGKNFFLVNDKGLANVIEAKTGNRLWTRRLGRGHDASPVRVGKSLICLDVDGTAWVLSAEAPFNVLAKNTLGESCHATPAVSEGQLFVRTVSHLYCIGKRKPTSDLERSPTRLRCQDLEPATNTDS